MPYYMSIKKSKRQRRKHYIVIDSTEGASGGGERMAFLYDKNKVMFKSMMSEIVLMK